METINENDKIQVTIGGNGRSGKTTFINKMIGSDTLSYIPTIGASFLSTTTYFDRKNINVLIWDLAGTERYRTFVQMFFRRTDLFILFVDLSTEINIEKDIEEWLTIYEQKKNHNNYTVVIVGNKRDIQKAGNNEKVKNCCEDKNIPYLDCSVIDDNYLTTLHEMLFEGGTYHTVMNNYKMKPNDYFKVDLPKAL